MIRKFGFSAVTENGPYFSIFDARLVAMFYLHLKPRAFLYVRVSKAAMKSWNKKLKQW